MKLPFSSQNVYSFPKNMDAKAAQTNSIAREPFQTKNIKTRKYQRTTIRMRKTDQ